MSNFFIDASLLLFEVVDSALDLMSFLVVLLLGEVCLNSLKIQEFGRGLENERKFFF